MRRWLCAILLTAFAITGNASALTTETLSPTSETEDLIWSILREEFSETAAAAIMGNLRYESELCPYRFENRTIGESEKLNAIRTKSRNRFIYSDLGYGLAMWYCTTNLERLWDWCEENGYDVDSAEGQVRFLMADYPMMAPMSYERMKYYEPEDIATASEDFRQSYEKSTSSEASQWGRARFAKEMLLKHADIDTSDVPYHFDIYIKVQELNERIKNELLLSGR